MGDPYLEFNKASVEIDSFRFNMAMTILREECEKRCASDATGGAVFCEIQADIVKYGYEQVAETVFRVDKYVSNERDRASLVCSLRILMKTVLQPDFELPTYWQRIMRGEIPGSTPIQVTREHFLGIAHVYQVMLDLIEGKIQEGVFRRLRPPPDWKPDA
jgi:hypothetical protein